MKKVLLYLFILTCLLGNTSLSYADYQGTIGTRFIISDSGFGNSKAKVYLLNGGKQVQAKVESWSDSSISCQWTKKISPGTYPLFVLPKGKGVSPISSGNFTIMQPSITEVTPNDGAAGDVITINGWYFTNKKPKVYLEDPNTYKRKSCKVKSFSMDSETGNSTLQFTIPKWGLTSYNLILINTIGQATVKFPFIGDISGKVTYNGSGLSGVTILLTGASSTSTSTDFNGNYTLSGLRNNSYTITPSKAGYAFNPTSITVTLSDENITLQNFTATAILSVVCGQTVTGDVILDKDLDCPVGTEYAIIIDASNITLDLGGHVLRGQVPGTGILAQDKVGIIIKNGIIEGFNEGIFILNTNNVTVENLTVRNQTFIDPTHFIFGVIIFGSHDVMVRDTLFEFPSVAHKEAVEIYESDVTVSNIEVRGGTGVNFSYAGDCDPEHKPNTGRVLNSKFSGIYIAGIWAACCSNVQIAGNDFTAAPGVGVGIQGDATFSGAVTGLVVEGNYIHDAVIGIDFRGIIESTISNNTINGNSAWGIAIKPSLGCPTGEPGYGRTDYDCVYSTANVISDNQTSGNGTDLYQCEACTGNIWERNTCTTKQGADIPECTH
jgi:parallel beta-helix repeat protein